MGMVCAKAGKMVQDQPTRPFVDALVRNQVLANIHPKYLWET